AHPSIKLFITHGGMLSTVEALHRGIPIVGIPIYGDQKLNMANAVRRGQGVVIDFTTISEESLTNSLNEVLNNPKYTQNAKRSSQILRDHETTPLDRAAFWVDYVIRHKGARHLRPASLELTWYQHISLDVILFLSAITIVFFVIFYKIIKWWIGRRNPSKKQKLN
ncbi:Glycosyltransferase, partial [Oryctes borbonicus]